jgi:hypothetical protein
MGAASEIIIINGSGLVGKDEVIRITNQLLGPARSVYSFSTIDTVKEACRRFFKVDPERDKNDAKRRFWSDVKDAWTRYNDGPFHEVLALVGTLDNLDGPAAPSPLVFLHVREPAEIAKLKTHFGARCHRLLVRNPRPPVPATHADQNVEQAEYDFLIENDGNLDDLRARVQAFLREVLGPEIRFNRNP